MPNLFSLLPKPISLRFHLLLLAGGLISAGGCSSGTHPAPAPPRPEIDAPDPDVVSLLAQQVEIRRTSYGVPHILAENLEAAAFGLAWVMMEDYLEEVPRLLLAANGRLAAATGRRNLDGDFQGRMAHDYAVQIFPGLPADVQSVMKGFAEGVNFFVSMNPDALPEWVKGGFTAEDVTARDLRVWDGGAVQAFLRSRQTDPGEEHQGSDSYLGEWVPEGNPNVGSNAWAFGPERVTTGNSILVRNPHLTYTSGYYEAHLTVPGVLDFYGDYRLGGPFTIIGGFNQRLGWSTTNNYGDPNQIYALLKSSDDPDSYLFGDGREAIETRRIIAEYLDSDSLISQTRDFRFTSLGPVLHENADTVFVLKTPALGQSRLGEQWLRMMQAQSLDEWKEAMRIQAKYSSNFTYADADGNIFYVWNASVPILPHDPSEGAPVFAAGPGDVWTDLVPWDDLPQLLNPDGGYLQNANDPPFFTNLNELLSPVDFPPTFPEPRLRLRSQHSLQLVHNDRIMSLEDVVELKHSMTMMMAQRVKDELVSLVLGTEPGGEVLEAMYLLAAWDNRVARESRGATLFEVWAEGYSSRVDSDSFYRVPWSMDEPTTTPLGLGDEDAALDAFHWAVEETAARFGSWDVAWGDVHRIRAGEVDLPVGGCSSGLGCFRVVGFAKDPDGKLRARTGDAWVLAVEFGEEPRAYSVLVYGNSNQENSPYFYNQAELFANNRLKPVAYAEADIQKNLVERYRPGEERHR